MQDLAQIFADVCKSNFLQLQLSVVPQIIYGDINPPENQQLTSRSLPTLPKQWTNSFDRIFTGLVADVISMADLLELFGPCLNRRNRFAAIFTFHRIWRMDKRYRQHTYKLSKVRSQKLLIVEVFFGHCALKAIKVDFVALT